MSLSPVPFTFLAVALLAATVAAAEGNALDQVVDQPIRHEEDIAHPIYEFVYEVGVGQEGNGGSSDFGHKESRDGGRTWGSYFQTLPDGRLQTVRYWADDSGYHAEIEYSGIARPFGRDGKEGQAVAHGAVEGQVVAHGGIEGATEAQKQRSPLIAALLESFPTEKPFSPIASTTQRPVTQLKDAKGIHLDGISEIQVTVSENGGPHRILQAIPIRQYTKRLS